MEEQCADGVLGDVCLLEVWVEMLDLHQKALNYLHVSAIILMNENYWKNLSTSNSGPTLFLCETLI